jgi:Tol biopolymer transport system component
VRAQVGLPEKTSFYLNPANPGPLVVSPDGRHVAFSATDSTGRTLLFVRTLAEPEARSIPGTQNAAYPFWAPNSRELGFFNSNDLCRVDIAGGPVVPLCTAENGKGGSWNENDVILFAPTHVASIHRVPASGGDPVEVTSVQADTTSRSHRFPCWLPGGEHFVYLAWRNPTTARETGNETVIRLGSLDASVDRELMVSQTNAIYAGGSLLHIHERNLMSRPFSASTLEFTGPPRPLLGGVLALQAAHAAVVSASDAGVLAYVAGGGVFGQSQLRWLSPEGEDQDALPETVTSPQGIYVSPDGRRVVVARADDRSGTFDIWIYEAGRDVGARFTFETESELGPIWSADGRRICYAAATATGTAIFEKVATGAGRPEKIVDVPGNSYPSGWSHDDRRLAFTLVGDDGDWDIWVLDRGRADSLYAVRESPFDEGMASFSPDGRWLAYNSNETGSPEVFVESLAGDGARYRISSSSGMHAQWSADGSRLYYLDTVGNLMETQIEAIGGALAIGETRTVASGVEVSLRKTYSVDRATGRLLVQRPMQDRVSNQLQLVTGWQNLLARD